MDTPDLGRPRTPDSLLGRCGVSTDAEIWSQVFDLGVDSKSQTSTAGIPRTGPQSAPRRKASSWLEIPARVWREEMRGTPPWKQLAQALSDIRNEPQLESQLRYYLRTTEPRFISLAHFRRGFGRWETPGRSSLPSSHAKFVPDPFPTQPINVAKLRQMAES